MSYAFLVGSDTPGAVGSCYYFSEDHRILFNCPEGTQRFCGDGRIRITRTTLFAFTRVDATTVMGLPGYLFTVNDTGVKSVSVVGPHPAISNFAAEVVRMFFWGHRKLDVNILKTISSSSESDLCPSLALSQTMAFGMFVTSAATSATVIVSYAIRLLPTKKFDPKRAAELGVLPGQKYAQLKKGDSVQSDKFPDRTVRPEDVLVISSQASGHGERGDSGVDVEPVFLVLDGDDCDAIQAGLEAYFSRLRASAASATQRWELVHCFHLARAELVSTPEYRERVLGCMATFFASPAATLKHHENGHVFATVLAASCATAFPTALVHRHHLHLLEPDYFPLPPSRRATDRGGGVAWPYSHPYRCSAHGTINAFEILCPTLASAFQMLSERFCAEMHLALPDVSSSSACVAASQMSQQGESRILFLGTGAAIPSKYRNVSGFLVEDAEGGGGTVVCDFGEGSLGQLRALCSDEQELDATVLKISLVFISHTHADHNLGLLSLIQFRNAAMQRMQQRQQERRREDVTAVPAVEALLIVAPYDFLSFFAACLGILNICSDQLILESFGGDENNNVDHQSSAAPSFQQLRDFCQRRGWEGEVFAVDHPAVAHGLVIRSPHHSWLYSGDTRPDARLIEAAKKFGPLQVLIHEATFDDQLAHEAAQKKHSTLGEALGVGKACGAQTVLLTHFSQRYPKVPAVSENQQQEHKYCFAFDLMVIPFSKLLQLPSKSMRFYRLLQEYETWQAGTTKRLREEFAVPATTKQQQPQQ